MPFSASDATRHKKGLSPAQAAKWAKIANAIREDCLDAGRDEKTCDGQAIRVANSKVGSKQNG